MKPFYLFVFSILFLFSQAIFITSASADCNITTLLRVGSKGAEVQCLQAKLGIVTDGSFGPLTKASVVVFQSNHQLSPDGVVGPLSRAALNVAVIVNDGSYPPGCTSSAGYSTTIGINCDIGLSVPILLSPPSSVPPVYNNNPVSGTISSVQLPKVFSVSPEKVRSGDTVNIYGENFSHTGNTVRLRYAQIEDDFNNLSSSDGKSISFVFQPPEVKTMNKEELLNLPPTSLNSILDPLKAAGGSIDDIVSPYRNMKNEDDLRQFLNKNGHSFDELYDKFYVTIENINGQGSSNKPILAGLRKLSFGSNALALTDNNFFSMIRSAFKVFAPKKAYAQTPLGGTNSGVITYCTCGPGYLTTMVDFSSNGGSGTFWWSPGFVPTVGTAMIAGPQDGFYTKNAGQCSMNSGPSCYTITANIANLPWGEAP